MGIPERYQDMMWETGTPGSYWRWRIAVSLKRDRLSAARKKRRLKP